MGDKYITLRNGTRFEFKKDHMEFMGIINATPDSFYASSRATCVEEAVKKAGKMLSEGAAWLDIGGESTRPGSDEISQQEELERVIPVVSAIKSAYPRAVISVDTWRAKTAEAAIAAGADVINDISAMTYDPDMVKVVADMGVPVILMHQKGKPKNMQNNPVYDDVVCEVYEFLKERISFALGSGIAKDKLIIDLGIGFGKTCDHNIELLRNINKFNELGCPQLMAISRKSFIGKVLNVKDPSDRLFGTVGVTAFGAANGVSMARVHDVLPNLQAARMIEILRKGMVD